MKIFGIGLSKTGTTSLASALEILGFRTKDYPGVQTYVPGDLSSIDPQVLAQHDALTDTPIPSYYRELDRHFPGAKFILTVRDMEGWLQSCRKQFTARLAEKQSDAHNRLFIDLYGTPVFDEARFRAGYERFVAGVLAHFKDRPQDLLVLDVAAGQGWPELCAFLGKPVPPQPFPKANVTRIQWMDLQALVETAREAGRELLSAHRGLGPAGGAASLLRKTMYSLAGGREFALQSATAASHKVLTRRLGRVNGDIPLVASSSPTVPLAERARWNHFWLVDPLDGAEGFGTDAGEFSVDIALIEDQKPIAGVVHAPLSDTTWFAMVGKGVYRQIGDGPPASLPDATAAPLKNGPVASRAVALCRAIDGATQAPATFTDLMDWQCAAPHAIARLLGRRLVAASDGGELGYNKADWLAPALRIA